MDTPTRYYSQQQEPDEILHLRVEVNLEGVYKRGYRRGFWFGVIASAVGYIIWTALVFR